MISNLKLHNYQGHPDTEVEFCSGLNVIVGTSDHGKSSMIRALLTVIQNSPSGTDLIRHGTDGYDVEIVVDGKRIGRRREGKSNLYLLDGEEFSGFKRDVPEPIANVLGISEVNVQRQHDPIYLLSDSPGEIARKLNRIVNLDKIESTTKAINSSARVFSKQLESDKEEVKDLEKQISDLSWIEEAAVVVEEHDRLESRRQRRQRVLSSLRMTVSDLESINLSEFDWISSAASDVNKAEELKVGLDMVRDRARRLNSLMGEIEDVESELDGPDPGELLPKIDHAFEDVHEVESKRKDMDRIKRLVENVLTVQDELSGLERDLQELEAEFHEKMKGACPLCGRGGDGDET